MKGEDVLRRSLPGGVSDLAARLQEIATATLAHKLALVHGDMSPKNILIGERPVFLDAECAWFGDPAFDIAFCCTHLLLKSIWLRAQAPALLEAYACLYERYLDGVTWEPADALNARAGSLVAALLLARIDGKSPVEYLADEKSRRFVREAARDLLGRSDLTLQSVGESWRARRAIS